MNLPAMILIVTYRPAAEQKAASAEEWRAIAEHVGALDGLYWKYWIRDVEDDTHGGVYLFNTPVHARAGGDRMKENLTAAGATNIGLRFFEIDVALSAVTRGVVPEQV